MAHITVPEGNALTEFLNQTGTGPFVFTWPYQEATDVNVLVDDVILVSSSYVLTPGTVLPGGIQGGSITLNAGVTTAKVVLVRQSPAGRADDFNVNGIKPDDVNTALDKLHMVNQDQDEQLNSTMRSALGQVPFSMPFGSNVDGKVLLGVSTNEFGLIDANSVLTFTGTADVVTTIALLKAVSDTGTTAVQVTGYTSGADGGGGLFITDNTTGHGAGEDDAVLNIVGTDTRLWVRVTQNSAVNNRIIPSAFSWAGIVPKICGAVGAAQPSETVSEYAKRVHSALIGGGVAWVDPIHGLDTNGGTEIAPVKTLSYAVRTLNPSQIYCYPGVYEKFDFRSTDTTGAKLKILTALGACSIREAADDPVTATWTEDGTYTALWKMPLTSANPDVLAVTDSGGLDIEGQPKSLAVYTSAANLNTFANGAGYYHDTGADELYIRSGRTEYSGTISGATQADPVVLTVTGHKIIAGDKFNVTSVGGMTELNGNTYVATSVTTNTITIEDTSGTPVDGTGFTTYTSGGTASARDFNFTKKLGLKIITGSSSSRFLIYGTKILFEGDWRMEGVFLQPLVFGTTKPYLYMDIHQNSVASKVPTISYTASHGLDALGAFSYLSGVWGHRTKGDNLHYTDSGGHDCQAVEINCKSTFAGDIDGEPTAPNTSNGSAMHGAGDILRINGVYRHNYGPNVVDSGTGESWNVGTTSGKGGGSGNDFGLYTTGPVMYLDNCASYGSAQADIATTSGGIIKHFATSYRTTSGTGIAVFLPVI